MGFVDRYPVFTLTVLTGALYALGRLAAPQFGVDPLVVFGVVVGIVAVAWRLSRNG
jgi:hypothetical protein